MPSFFARLTREDVTLNGWELSCAESATLATFAQAEDKRAWPSRIAIAPLPRPPLRA